jgi:GTP-binding protein HflX
LENNREFLLTDTVGFIDKLPHHLVKAFRSTLEEVTEADLLVHVIDCADPNHHQHRKLTNEILKQIGAGDVPMIYAYNKADLADMAFPVIKDDEVYMSAKQHAGISELLQIISGRIFQRERRCEMKIPYSEGQLVAYFNEHGRVLKEEYEEDGIRMIVVCSEKDARRYEGLLV